jgi:hypothetical protein
MEAKDRDVVFALGLMAAASFTAAPAPRVSTRKPKRRPGKDRRKAKIAKASRARNR